ncbi:MAG: DUF805 domain-containing protein [Thermoguttaceae bacterium]|nr:DUF805 domain-containing protein [Thermoguttaceae bacterium]
MPYCPQCGTEISGGSFCPQCGAQIGVFGAENPYEFGSQTQYVRKDSDPNAPLIPGFVEAYIRFWKKGGIVDGRASRTEFWYVFLWHCIIQLPFYIAAGFSFICGCTAIIAGVFEDPYETSDDVIMTLLLVVVKCSMAIISAYNLVVVIPKICLYGRRFHDINCSAWFSIICLIPVINCFALFVIGVIPPTNGTNKYGPAPVKRAK